MDWEAMIERFGGRYHLCTLMIRRAQQLVKGAVPLVQPPSDHPWDMIVREMEEGKIGLELASKE
jgi:DNA-directed RNA polymerase subunit K/omega